MEALVPAHGNRLLPLSSRSPGGRRAVSWAQSGSSKLELLRGRGTRKEAVGGCPAALTLQLRAAHLGMERDKGRHGDKTLPMHTLAKDVSFRPQTPSCSL